MKNWKIGIVGAGSMGRGIAQVAATHRHQVLVYDNNRQAVNKARTFLQRILKRQVEKDRMTEEEFKSIFDRISFVDDLNKLDNCELVIEAIVEDLEIKKSIFQSLEEITDQNAILATNTSSLSVSAIASACDHTHRVIGIHFFNPAPLMKLVEIIPAIQTSDDIKQQAIQCIDSWHKETVIAKDTPGFIVNRVARPFYSEALRIYEEGIADIIDIDQAMTSIGKFKMGPFTLMDYIGNDINYKVTSTVYNAFHQEPRYKPAFTQKQLVDAGWLGRKSGKGFYNYENNNKPIPTDDKELLRRIFYRILVMLINEAADAFYYNIASANDIETAMTKGVNYPKGLLSWANEIGIQNVVDQIDDLYEFYHEDRYRVSAVLRNYAQNGKNFFED